MLHFCKPSSKIMMFAHSNFDFRQNTPNHPPCTSLCTHFHPQVTLSLSTHFHPTELSWLTFPTPARVLGWGRLGKGLCRWWRGGIRRPLAGSRSGAAHPIGGLAGRLLSRPGDGSRCNRAEKLCSWSRTMQCYVHYIHCFRYSICTEMLPKFSLFVLTMQCYVHYIH